jgi:hypothetical protein
LTIGIAPRRGKPRWLAALGFIVLVGGLLGVGNAALAAPPAVAVNLDQCRNGGLVTSGTQTFTQCLGTGSGSSGWVNGNAGAANAHYAEGESISYRARLSNLTSGDAVTLILGYDVIHNGHDALDYLTDKNRWQLPETTVAATPDLPCSGVSGCVDTGISPTPALLAITAPPTNIQVDKSKTLANGCQTAGGGLTQQPGTSFNAVPSAQRNMEFFGATPGTFAYVGPAPSLLDKNGDQEQQVQVTFTATSANPVLAWGAHIASRLDWGCSGAPQSASGISGSPYHMRIKSAIVNGGALSLGNQDRSLSAAAVVFLNPGITTTLSASTGSIGDTVHDSATLTGATSTAGGTVTYTVYTDNACSQGAQSAGTKTVTNGVVPDSNGIQFNSAGTFYWQAVYSGDGNNAPATSVCTTEQLVIGKNSPSIATTLSASTGSIGDTIHDSATLTGATSNAGGSVTYTVYTDNACSQGAQSAGTKTVTNGVVPDSNGIQFNSAGTFYWQAVYTGDANNDGATSVCTTEQLVIGKNSPSISTAQNLIPNDDATIAGATSSAGGTITFNLFDPSDATCSGAPALTQTVNVSGNGTYSTTNTTFIASATGTWRWQVDYSGDGNNDATSSACGVENFTITNQ